MTGYRSFLVMFLTIGLSACVLGSGGTAIGPTYGAGCASNVAKHIKNVDWAEASVVTVQIRQDEFEPMVISIRQDNPYIFRIENRDDYEHLFMASKFFRSVAIAGINSPNSISKASCINGVRIGAMETVELRLSAVHDGRYEYMDRRFSLTSLGSTTGVIYVGQPLKYTGILIELTDDNKSTPDSAAQDGGADTTPENQPSDANPFDAVEPATPQPSDANPFDAVEPATPQPSDASPFDAVEPVKPQPSDASPFDAVEPAKPQPSGTSPFDAVEPAKPQPPDASPVEAVERVKPRSKNLTPFDTVKPGKSSVLPPASHPVSPQGSVPDPFSSTKPVLRNIQIPDPFPDTGQTSGGETDSFMSGGRMEQEKSDTLGTDTTESVTPIIGGYEQVVPPPPPPLSGDTSVKPKPDIKAKIKSRIKGFFDSLLGN